MQSKKGGNAVEDLDKSISTAKDKGGNAVAQLMADYEAYDYE